MESMVTDKAFWAGKTVLVTGHTGFKGSWLSIWLERLGARVIGFSLPPPEEPSLFDLTGSGRSVGSHFGDLRNFEHLLNVIRDNRPAIVFHMAAQALVSRGYEDPIETYSTNVMGTVHVLEAVRRADCVDAAVVVTSDKCYENKEWIWAYREIDPMGGYDPYSSSKGCAELVVSAYTRSFFDAPNRSSKCTMIASVRAGNVIGGGDWSMNRLVPDVLRALERGGRVSLRYPRAIRPWQHVLEPLHGYLMLAERLASGGSSYSGAWNFGPSLEDERPVVYIVEKLASLWGGTFQWVLEDGVHPHEAGRLSLDSSKARTYLGWRPAWKLEQALERIVEWHKEYLLGKDMRSVCEAQIDAYENTLGSLEGSI